MTAIARSNQLASRRMQLVGATALLLLSLTAGPGLAQGLQPGEAFATRFSGTVPGPDGPSIDTQGTVGSILDLRNPGQPPQGQHWINEPQRNPVTAAETGQVFGVAFDDATPPNIYVTATAAFGLHRTSDNAQWMPGMFGRGGPGAIYKLDAANGYKPVLFSVIRLNDRQNTGAALGNIAYDRWNKQFLVSDLETGMIHRISLEGRDLGSFDHGTAGRASFVDAQSGQQQSLQPIAFNPSSQARITDCEGKFDNTPECWNIAESNRRVWGLGVWKGPNGETRLYYSVASSPDLGGSDWNNLPEDEKRNTLWSVRLGADGSFDASGVRRELVLPDFFSNPQDIARAGYSRPVSDITFPACSGRPIMLVAERGGLRNLGLGRENAFATPHEARTIRYELDQSGTWRAMGRYDIGNYDRSNEGAPYVNANCAGGATFGPGYSAEGRATGPADGFVWISGDKLCSPEGPCNAPASQQVQAQQVSVRGGAQSEYQPDDSEVHGAQGQPEDMYNALLPPTATAEKPQQVNPVGPGNAYMVDLDINVDEAGNPIEGQNAKNDATMIGDISVYQICPLASAAYAASYPLMAVPVAGVIIHGRWASHYRHHSHSRFFSHWRWHSHTRWASHDRRWSDGHQRTCSDGHYRRLSQWHRRGPSYPDHCRGHSHQRKISHGRSISHDTTISHDRSISHERGISHDRGVSHIRSLSHQRTGSHSTSTSEGHTPVMSHAKYLSPGTHNTVRSQGHTAAHSHARHLSPGTHNTIRSQGNPGGPNGHLRAESKSQPPSTPPTTHVRGTSQPGTGGMGGNNGGGMGGGNSGGGMGGMSGGGMGGMTGGGMGGMTGGMTGGMGGMHGGGMTGMSGGGMASFTPNRAPQMGRVGPQNFRGGGNIGGGGRRR